MNITMLGSLLLSILQILNKDKLEQYFMLARRLNLRLSKRKKRKNHDWISQAWIVKPLKKVKYSYLLFFRIYLLIILHCNSPYFHNQEQTWVMVGIQVLSFTQVSGKIDEWLYDHYLNLINNFVWKYLDWWSPQS